MRTKLLLAAALLAAGCKPGTPATDSQVKDFAFKATAANYAVLFGNVLGNDDDSPSSDLLRYENYLLSGYLGKFDVVLKDHAAGKAAVLAAFAKIGESLTEDSTVFVAYTGEAKNGKLAVKDGELAVTELVNALGGKKAARFFMFSDAVGNETGKYFAKNDVVKGSFRQIVEFLAYSPAVKAGAGSSYAGRLSAEFTGETDRAYTEYKASGKNPTLANFFANVQKATAKVAGVRRADYYVNDAKIVEEPLLNDATFPKVAAQKPLQSNITAQTPVAQSLSLAFTRTDGSAGNLSSDFKDATYMLIEISSQWCQPCALAATRLAANAALQAKYKAGGCHQTTLIVSDGEEPDLAGKSCGSAPAKLCAWNGYLEAANPAQAASAYSHSVLINETGKAINAGFLTGLNPPEAIKRYPSFFVVDRAGQVVATASTGADGAKTSGEDESVAFLLQNCK